MDEFVIPSSMNELTKGMSDHEMAEFLRMIISTGGVWFHAGGYRYHAEGNSIRVQGGGLHG